MNFKGKVAMITGAALGIGRAVAMQLAENGADIIITDIDGKKLEMLAEELKKYGGRVEARICDVSDESTVTSIAAESIERFGKIDILINNAAVWRSFMPFTELSTDEWKRFFDINVMGLVYCTKAVINKMIENRYGRIINIGSVAGVYGNANMTHYSASKGAVIAFTKALAKEVSAKGVLVNCVSPGSVSPSENEDIDYFKPSELSFIGRTGTDRENANLICFLASDEASYISGQNIQIDGCRKKQ